MKKETKKAYENSKSENKICTTVSTKTSTKIDDIIENLEKNGIFITKSEWVEKAIEEFISTTEYFGIQTIIENFY